MQTKYYQSTWRNKDDKFRQYAYTRYQWQTITKYDQKDQKRYVQRPHVRIYKKTTNGKIPVEISFMDWGLCEKSHILPQFECMSSISTWTFFCLVTSCQKNHTIFIFNKYIFILVKKREYILSPKDIVHKGKADQPVTFRTTKC